MSDSTNNGTQLVLGRLLQSSEDTRALLTKCMTLAEKNSERITILEQQLNHKSANGWKSFLKTVAPAVVSFLMAAAALLMTLSKSIP